MYQEWLWSNRCSDQQSSMIERKKVWKRNEFCMRTNTGRTVFSKAIANWSIFRWASPKVVNASDAFSWGSRAPILAKASPKLRWICASWKMPFMTLCVCFIKPRYSFAVCWSSSNFFISWSRKCLRRYGDVSDHSIATVAENRTAEAQCVRSRTTHRFNQSMFDFLQH